MVNLPLEMVFICLCEWGQFMWKTYDYTYDYAIGIVLYSNIMLGCQWNSD